MSLGCYYYIASLIGPEEARILIPAHGLNKREPPKPTESDQHKTASNKNYYQKNMVQAALISLNDAAVKLILEKDLPSSQHKLTLALDLLRSDLQGPTKPTHEEDKKHIQEIHFVSELLCSRLFLVSSQSSEETMAAIVLYHTGVVRQLQGDFLCAQQLYNMCLAVTEGPDDLTTKHVQAAACANFRQISVLLKLSDGCAPAA